MINVGVIGYGYWGPNLVRNFMMNPNTTVVGVADFSKSRLDHAGKIYPSLTLTSDADDLISDPSIDAIIIATPVASHFGLAMAALSAGKHVLVEKPVAASVEQAERLVEEASRRNLVLMVDHTFAYTGAVRKIRELVRDGGFGQLRYFDSTRINLGIFQHDVNVLWDLAVHDLSILARVATERPIAVSAVGHAHLDHRPVNTAYLTLFFSENFIAHVNVNWLSPVKVRRTLISGTKKMIVYDDLEASEKVKVFDHGIDVNPSPDDVHRMQISYRTGDLWSPKVPADEALQIEVGHFVECINRGERPLTDGVAGLEIVRILEAADQSMSSRGVPIELPIGPGASK